MKTRSNILVATLSVIALTIGIAGIVHAQKVRRIDKSPRAVTAQRIGKSDVTFVYHRPAVKGREIWGTKLVPYGGKPFPWRAGANENTTVTFENDVTINGKPLAAGAYGFHTIPSEGDWILIFNNNSTSWGSFRYKEDEDALRVTVTPEEAPHEEWLRYGFEDLSPTSATAFLRWEKVKISFTIELDGT